MKRLTLLRHAKSSWDDAVARDFDRPLNKRGRRAAHAVGREMSAQQLAFDHVIASPAVRVRETLADVVEAFGKLEPSFDERVYLASAGALLGLVQEVEDSASSVLLVGHNPGLENLALLLARPGAIREELEAKYPTGTLVEIALDAQHWSEVGEAGGELVRMIRPRDLDPELGPDEDSF